MGKLVLLLLVAGIAVGVWQKDKLMAWPPVADLLQSLGLGNTASDDVATNATADRTPQQGPSEDRGEQTPVNQTASDRGSKQTDNNSGTESSSTQQPTNRNETQYSDKIQELLNEALTLESKGNQVFPVKDNALVKYQTVLELEPDHPAASAAIERISTSLQNQLERALAANDDRLASQLVSQLALIMPETELTDLRRQLVQAERRRKEAEIEQQKQAMIEDLLARADRAIRNNRLTQPDDDNALLYLKQIDDVDAGHAGAADRKKQIAARFRSAAATLLENDELETAETQLGIAASLEPGSAQLQRLRERLRLYQQQRLRNTVTAAQRDQIERLLQQASDAMDRGNLMSPPGDSVYDHLKAVLRIDPKQAEARSRLTELAQRLLDNARNSLAAEQYSRALEQFRAAEQSDARMSQLPGVRRELSLGLVRWIEGLIDAGQLNSAENMLGELSDLDPGLADINRLQLRLNLAREG